MRRDPLTEIRLLHCVLKRVCACVLAWVCVCVQWKLYIRVRVRDGSRDLSVSVLEAYSLSLSAVAAAAGDRLPVIVAPVDKYTTTERVHRPDERIRVN